MIWEKNTLQLVYIVRQNSTSKVSFHNLDHHPRGRSCVDLEPTLENSYKVYLGNRGQAVEVGYKLWDMPDRKHFRHLH